MSGRSDLAPGDLPPGADRVRPYPLIPALSQHSLQSKKEKTAIQNEKAASAHTKAEVIKYGSIP